MGHQPQDPESSTDTHRRAALEGLVVLDASRVLAGPYCTMVLGDLGADVIKIERPPSGDDTRAWGPPYLSDPGNGLSAYFLSCNRNKRSVAIDLKSVSGRELFTELVRKADVLVENFAPGVAERLGIGGQTLAEINSRLVHCSITAFGDQPGPGYDLVIQGMSGLMSITGAPDGPPMKVGVAITDVIAGLHAATSILAALHARTATGRGDHLTISLLGAATAALVNVGQAYLVSGNPPQRWGNAHPQIVPYQAFAAKDGHFTIACGNDRLFQRLCKVVGRPELATDERFVTNPLRVLHRDTLIAALEPIFLERHVDEWLDSLHVEQIPCGPVWSLDQLFDGGRPPPGVELRKLTTSIGATYRTTGPPVQMNGLRADLYAASLVGEHTDEVLHELLGLDKQAIARLREEGAIGGCDHGSHIS